MKVILIIIFAFIGRVLFSQTDSISIMLSEYRYSEVLIKVMQIPDSVKATKLLIQKGVALKGLNEYQKAIQTFEMAYMRDPLNVQATYELYSLYRLIGYYSKAIEFLDKLQELPVSLNFEAERASIYFQMEDFTGSKNLSIRIVKYDSLNVSMIKQLARSFDNLGNADSAIYWYERTNKLAPLDFFTINRLSRLYIDKKEYDKGLGVTKAYLKTDSANTKIKRLIGYLHYLKKDYISAAQLFLDLVNKGDTTTFTYKYLGISFYKNETLDSASFFLEKAYSGDTLDSNTCFYLGQTYTWGNNPKGIVMLNKAIENIRPSPQYVSLIYQKLSDAYIVNFQYDLAAQALLKAHEANTSDTLLLLQIGTHYDNYNKDKSFAIKYYTLFLDGYESAFGSSSNPLVQSFIKSISVRNEALKKGITLGKSQQQKKETITREKVSSTNKNILK